MRAHLGLCTSLYSSLDAKVVELLERAIWFKKTGRYQDALSVFKHELAFVKNSPVVLIEWSNLYLEHARYGELYRLLEKPLLERGPGQDGLDRPEWRLLALHWKIVMTRHKGILGPAVAELERTRDWLWDLPVAEYSDIHAICVSRYYMLLVFVRLAMNLDPSELQLIPKAVAARIPWQGFADLRISLIERSMVKEAVLVFRCELHRTPLCERHVKATEVLAAVANHHNLHHRFLFEADIKEQMTKTLVELHDLNGAKQMAAECESALERWCTENEVAAKADLPLYLDLRCVTVNFMSDPLEKLKSIEELSVLAERTSHKKLPVLMDVAAETALRVARESDSKDLMTRVYSLRERIEYEYEYISEDLCSLVDKRCEMYTDATQNLVDRQKELEWSEGFFSKYPDFQSPLAMAHLYRSRAVLLESLFDISRASEAREKAKRWSRTASQSRDVWYYNWANIVAPGDGALGDAPYDSEDEADSGRSTLELTIHSAGNDRSTVTRKLMHLLIDWAFEDVRNGSLSGRGFQELLDLGEDQVNSVRKGAADVNPESLKSQDVYVLFRKLFMPANAEDQSPNRKFQLLRNWLSNPPKGSRNIRLYWLLAFLEARKGTEFIDYEIKNMEMQLDLQAQLPRVLKTVTQDSIPFWHASLAFRHWTKFKQGGSWALFDCWDEALKSNEHSRKALDGLHKIKKAVSIAEQQRLRALINWYKIRRLTSFQALSGIQTLADREAKVFAKLSADVSSDTSIEDQMRQLRKQALEWLYDTDNIFSASEREASWEDGIEGIERRAQLARTQQNYTTIHRAVALLLAPPDPVTQEVINTLWELVQKYKTRLLSTAIGMYRPSPPGLVSKILASEQYGPMYQEMVDLQKSIDAAAANDRFHLRRRLDAHRERIKMHPPLRQLINLREGTPIRLDEIEDVSREVDAPVVLVDWFYYPDPMKGKFLLLLTARANEPPTADVLDVNHKDIEEWITQNLNASNADQHQPGIAHRHIKDSFNRVCGGLVAPLAGHTKPGDVLVLSPTEQLHRLPLHALKVGDDALIRRNVVVYAHSHSLLRASVLAARHAAAARAPLNPRFISGIGTATATLDERAYAAGRRSVVELAARFDVQPLIDAAASKSAFLRQAQQARLLHVHTHCVWNGADPLDHYLQFTSVSAPVPSALLPVAEEPGSQTQGPAIDTLTAREVFALKLQQGVHVNLIACSAGLADVQAGDEVLGLVPALLYSGASSTVSTLWPIKDAVGARFSEAFFESFLAQVEEGEDEGANDGKGRTRWVDLAFALQHAITELDPDQDEPLLDWAGFVMHGFWMFGIGEGEVAV